MKAAGNIALGVALLGTASSLVFCGMTVVAALRFRRRRLQAQAEPATFVPAVSVLKPLHGAEPGLEQNLESFFQQEYPGSYELLFCARHPDDAGLAIARSLARKYPAVQARILTCGEPRFPNPKMYSLSVMTDAAQHSVLVTSDADARVAPDYLLRCVQELRPDRNVTLASCLYLGTTDPGAGFFTRLDALGKSVEMSSGVLVADMLNGTDFALGVTMILHRDAFNKAGGCEELGHFWAEDFVLGNRLAGQGLGVRMSTHVIRLVVTAESIADSFRNQLRWMQSTRRSRPAGHLGTGLTFAMPFGLLGFAVEAFRGKWMAAWLFLGVACLNRMAQAAVVLDALGETEASGSLAVAKGALVYPLRDLLGSMVWLASYLPADTSYHGTQFRIMPDGTLQRD